MGTRELHGCLFSRGWVDLRGDYLLVIDNPKGIRLEQPSTGNDRK